MTYFIIIYEKIAYNVAATPFTVSGNGRDRICKHIAHLGESLFMHSYMQDYSPRTSRLIKHMLQWHILKKSI